MEKPVIEYPCQWSYKIIGQDEKLLRTAASNAAGNKAHTISISNQSSGGKYVSICLELDVNNEDERLEIFAKLKSDSNVKIVM